MEGFSDRWVRIMADYCSEGVWDSEGCGCSVDDLPLSDGLRAAIRAEFSAHGLALARQVKAELPDWTVIYFDEEQAAKAGWGGDRSAFEYEVKAGDET